MRYERLKNRRIIRHTYYFLRGIFDRSNQRKKAEKVIASFNVNFDDVKAREVVIDDMVKFNQYYGFEFEEYLYYQFHEKNKKERLRFVAEWEHSGYSYQLNNRRNNNLFDDKWNTYNHFKQYFLRKVLLCENENSRTEFDLFIKENNSFIVKPLNSSCGRGIQIIDQSSSSEDSTDLWGKLVSEYGGRFIIEDLIRQVPEMAKFNPSSVNTVRVPTIRMDDEILIIHPCMRMGKYGNCVDNASAGGIICAVDVDTGRLFTAADEHGNVFETHPDSNERIIGFQIPRWEEAKAFVLKLASVVPDNRYTGWDIALTNEGWKLVEANRRGQFIWQIATKVGFRSEIDNILKKLGKKY